MRWVIVRVLPVPAPARMQTGPCTASAAARWSGSRAARTCSACSTFSIFRMDGVGAAMRPSFQATATLRPAVPPAVDDRPGVTPGPYGNSHGECAVDDAGAPLAERISADHVGHGSAHDV